MSASINSDSSKYVAGENGHSTAHSSYAPSVPISVYRELATELKTTQMTLDALSQQNQQLLRQNQLLRTEIQRFVQAAEQLGHFAGVTPPQEVAPMPGARPSMERELPTAPVRQHVEEVAATAAPPQKGMPEALMQRVLIERHQTERSGGDRPESEDWVPPSAIPTGGAASKETPRSEAGGVPKTMAIVPQPKERKRSPKGTGTKPQFFTEQSEGMHPLSRVASRADMSNLWLATTILLVVVSAFGAGFLIMRPLLNNR